MGHLRLPRRLHDSYELEDGSKSWFVDLDEGFVLPTSDPMRAILRLAPTHTEREIAVELSGRYPARDLEDAFRTLELVDRHGYVFCPRDSSDARARGQAPHICVSPGFLGAREGRSPYATYANAALLEALCEHARVTLILPATLAEQAAPALAHIASLDVVRVRDAFVGNVVRSAPEGCDGVLLLAPCTTSELAWYRHVDAPVVVHARSEALGGRQCRNALHRHAHVQRSQDGVVVDAPWLVDNADSEERGAACRRHVSVGLTPDLQTERASAAEALGYVQERFPGRRLGREAVIGVSLASVSEHHRAWLGSLCSAHLEWTFVVLHPAAPQIAEHAGNLVCLPAESTEDLRTMANLVARFTALIYEPTAGAPALPFAVARYAGCPATAVEAPNRRPDVVARDVTDAIYQHLTVGPPVTDLHDYSWAAAALRIIDMFERLGVGAAQGALPRALPLYHRRYDRGSDSLSVSACSLPGMEELDLPEALAASLGGHSESETRSVLRWARRRSVERS